MLVSHRKDKKSQVTKAGNAVCTCACIIDSMVARKFVASSSAPSAANAGLCFHSVQISADVWFATISSGSHSKLGFSQNCHFSRSPLMDSPGTSGGLRRRRYGLHLPLNLLQAPVSGFLELLGVLRGSSQASDHEATTTAGLERIRVSSTGPDRIRVLSSNGGGVADDETAEVSVRIIGTDEMDQIRVSEGASASSALSLPATSSDEGANNPLMPTSLPEGADTAASGNQNSQRYDFQQFARWVEQVLPFSLFL